MPVRNGPRVSSASVSPSPSERRRWRKRAGVCRFWAGAIAEIEVNTRLCYDAVALGTRRSEVEGTLTSDARLLNKRREAVGNGLALSLTSLVSDGLRARLRELREAEIARDQAAADPMFVADVEAVQEDVEYADAETAAMIPGYD